jgi:hypothetical protein
MRLKFSTTSPTQDEYDSLPRLPLLLSYGHTQINVVGLVDSGATVSVLPYRIGLELGYAWDERKAVIRLAGNLGNLMAQPVFALAQVGDFEPVRLGFAWVQTDRAPMLLGHSNFFIQFDVCFYRADLEFEVKPHIAKVK